MDQNNTPEAEVINLHEKLQQATETKPPSATAQTMSWIPEGEEPIPSAPSTTQIQPEQSAEPQGKIKVPDNVKRASAETATLMFDQLLTVLGTFRVNSKFKKRFSTNEMERVNDLDMEHTPIENLTNDVDKQTHIKFNTLLKKRDKKIKNLPLDESETSRITESFYHVFKLKDIAMPPEYLLFANLTFTLIDRAIETEID